jgi:hypothetical protein
MIYGYKFKRKRLILIIISVVLLSLLLSYQLNKVTGLSMDNRKSEFNYLTEFVEENHLPLALFQKDYNVLKEVSEEKLLESLSLPEYAAVVYFYLDSLESRQTQLMLDKTVAHYNYILELDGSLGNSIFEDILRKDEVIKRYDLENANYHPIKRTVKLQRQDKKPDRVFEIRALVENEVAYLKIYTFDLSVNEGNGYSELLSSALEEYSGYEKLIIDVRGARGYNEMLWSQGIVASLIQEDLIYNNNYLLKGEDSKSYYESLGYSVEGIDKSKDNLRDLSDELGATYVLSEEKRISSRGMDLSFENIYMLANEKNYGSSAIFAETMKKLELAELVGNETMPRQFSKTPIYHNLPSGYIFSLEALMYVNSEGKLNYYNGTMPDYVVEKDQVIVDSIDQGIEFIINLP